MRGESSVSLIEPDHTPSRFNEAPAKCGGSLVYVYHDRSDGQMLQ